MVIPWFHKNLNTNNTPLLRCLLSFRTFHKPYQVLELIHCTEYLSPESRNSHFWKLKIRHHNYSRIKYICSKYYLQILEEFHKKLCELQQLEDEFENNVRKWHWVGHVQKTIIKTKHQQLNFSFYYIYMYLFISLTENYLHILFSLFWPFIAPGYPFLPHLAASYLLFNPIYGHCF